jgi:hypothetical protein
MNKILKYVVLFLVFDAVVIGAYFGYRALRGSPGASPEEFPWVTIDELYQPQNDVEAFIKTDAENRGAFPVMIRNYGDDPGVLKLFKGKQFARPSPNVIGMFYKGLADWMLVDIKYKAEPEREVVRTVLYIYQDKQWRVGDSGSLLR